MVHEDVIRLARDAHAKHWRMSSDAGTGDKLAEAVTCDWQASVLSESPGRFVAEHSIAMHLRERIDLVDLEVGICI